MFFFVVARWLVCLSQRVRQHRVRRREVQQVRPAVLAAQPVAGRRRVQHQGARSPARSARRTVMASSASVTIHQMPASSSLCRPSASTVLRGRGDRLGDEGLLQEAAGVALSAVPSVAPAKPRSSGRRSSREIGIGPGASTRMTAALYSVSADAGAPAAASKAAAAHAMGFVRPSSRGVETRPGPRPEALLPGSPDHNPVIRRCSHTLGGACLRASARCRRHRLSASTTPETAWRRR